MSDNGAGESVAVYSNVRVLETLHGHGGNTKVEWVDA